MFLIDLMIVINNSSWYWWYFWIDIYDLNDHESAFTVFLFIFNISSLDFHVGISFWTLSFDQLLLNWFPDIVEYFWYIVVIFCTTLYKGYSIFTGKCTTLGETNLSFCLFTINFVSYYDFAHGLRLTFVDLFDPVLKIIEWFSICNRIN